MLGSNLLLDDLGAIVRANDLCNRYGIDTIRKLEEEGMLARDFVSTVILTPPLCITKSDVDEVVNIMERVVGGLAKDLGY